MLRPEADRFRLFPLANSMEPRYSYREYAVAPTPLVIDRANVTAGLAKLRSRIAAGAMAE